MSKEKTQCNSSSSASDTSADYGEVVPIKSQKPTVSFSGLAIAQSSASEKHASFENLECDAKSEHSTDDQTQGQMLDDDLMRIIEDQDQDQE